MPMPYPLHPAQYLHFGAAAAAAGTGGFAFPYVLPCWTPQPPPQVAPVAAPGPGQAGPGGEPNRSSIPGGVVPPSRASSFRPFRQASGNLGGGLPAGQEGVAEANSAKAPSTGSGGMNRVSSLSASQGSSFSAISDYHSDPDPLQGCGYASSGCGDNTQANSSPERPHNHHQPAAVSGRETPDRGRASSSSYQSANPPPPPTPAPPQSDHSASSEPPATTTTPTATNANKHPLQPNSNRPHQHDNHPPPPFPSTPPNSSANTAIPEGGNPGPSPPPNSRTSESQPPPPPPRLVLQQPSTTRPPIRPRNMPYVSAKGTGPSGRTVTGFLYKFDDKDKVSIVCVCHGSSFTPAEFVRHAGATDVDNPLRHIVMLEELPPKHRVMVSSA